MAESPITKDQVADVVPDVLTEIFTIGDPPAGLWGKFTLQKVAELLCGICADTQVERFNPNPGESQIMLTPPDPPAVGADSSNPVLISVYRNGLLVQPSEYTQTGVMITFVTSFGNSTGGVGGETVTVYYV